MSHLEALKCDFCGAVQAADDWHTMTEMGWRSIGAPHFMRETTSGSAFHVEHSCPECAPGGGMGAVDREAISAALTILSDNRDGYGGLTSSRADTVEALLANLG
jgi:hypothetical protein